MSEVSHVERSRGNLADFNEKNGPEIVPKSFSKKMDRLQVTSWYKSLDVWTFFFKTLHRMAGGVPRGHRRETRPPVYALLSQSLNEVRRIQ